MVCDIPIDVSINLTEQSNVVFALSISFVRASYRSAIGGTQDAQVRLVVSQLSGYDCNLWFQLAVTFWLHYVSYQSHVKLVSEVFRVRSLFSN